MGSLLLVVAFGVVISGLPVALVQPVVIGVLSLANAMALVLMVRRAIRGGPEKQGWWLLSLSYLGVMAANAALFQSPSSLNGQSRPEILFVILQPIISMLQAWALLSWPFRASGRKSQRIMNLLGCLLFGGSLFLVLWTTALFQELDHGQWPVFFRMVGLAIRVSILGGVVTYILAEDPRRIRGPVGFIFVPAVIVLALITLLRPYLFDQTATMQPTPFLSIVLAAPLFYGMAAWLGLPVEVPVDQPRLRYPAVEGLIYLPFVAAGTMLILSALRHRESLMAPLAGFMAISVLLLARQFLLIREVRKANERLEERVLARTRSLEELQKVMLRTERLNSIGALGAGLAHDLNNALAGIRATVELALMRVEEGRAPATSDLDRILVAADQSATLTARLMAFARQEEEVLGPLDLVAEVSNLEGILRMMLSRSVALKLDLGAGPVWVHGSRTQLEQVLVNLVGNARDALPQGGVISLKIRVEPRSEPPRACLEVADTGVGMPPEVVERIFQPFFTTKAPGKGTGLGLASVRHLVEGAGGSIQVESQPGQGTRFTLRFLLIG